MNISHLIVFVPIQKNPDDYKKYILDDKEIIETQIPKIKEIHYSTQSYKIYLEKGNDVMFDFVLNNIALICKEKKQNENIYINNRIPELPGNNILGDDIWNLFESFSNNEVNVHKKIKLITELYNFFKYLKINKKDIFVYLALKLREFNDHLSISSDCE